MGARHDPWGIPDSGERTRSNHVALNKSFKSLKASMFPSVMGTQMTSQGARRQGYETVLWEEVLVPRDHLCADIPGGKGCSEIVH